MTIITTYKSKKQLLTCSYNFLLVAIFVIGIYGKLNSFIEFNAFIRYLTDYSETTTLIIANLILSTEIYIVFALIFLKQVKNIYTLIIIITIVFQIIILYLFYFSIVENCFCFGNFLIMSPAESFLKNIFILIIAIYLWLDKSSNSYNYIYDIIFLSIIFAGLYYTNNKVGDYFKNVVIESIDYEQLKKLDDFVLIDARSFDKFNELHIPGAINIPNNDMSNIKFQRQLEDLVLNYPRKIFVTYCDMTVCGISRALGEKIKSKYPNKEVYVFKEGLKEWLKENN